MQADGFEFARQIPCSMRRISVGDEKGALPHLVEGLAPRVNRAHGVPIRTPHTRLPPGVFREVKVDDAFVRLQSCKDSADTTAIREDSCAVVANRVHGRNGSRRHGVEQRRDHSTPDADAGDEETDPCYAQAETSGAQGPSTVRNQAAQPRQPERRRHAQQAQWDDEIAVHEDDAPHRERCRANDCNRTEVYRDTEYNRSAVKRMSRLISVQSSLAPCVTMTKAMYEQQATSRHEHNEKCRADIIILPELVGLKRQEDDVEQRAWERERDPVAARNVSNLRSQREQPR